MSVIDLRSDTVTKPTDAMRRAMAEAVVGDDVYGDDPTVNRLQAVLAERVGFEAGLFVPSGSMSNQIALAVHAGRGHEVIAPEGAHIYEYELATMAVLAGLLPRLVPARGGVPHVEDVRAAIHRSIHQAPTGLISLENTHNRAGGTVLPLAVTRAITKLAKDEGLPIHLDGARAFNAASALDVPIEKVCEGFDSVSICLSKGLGAPVGSVLLGSRAFISEAHRYRKMLGGGMRQAGILAAAGLVALETMPERLGFDHVRARRLAEALAGIPGVTVDMTSVQTNMVYADVQDPEELCARCASEGVLFSPAGPRQVRLVTHRDVDDDGIERAIEVVRSQVRSGILA